ncbi:helix-turn-helix transcriptional regulator [Kallotenue papyrolyticum]|uniref:helix-turn-helix transcriptional regulator n=1 Tax=Kallotenue papyrolyticum TaxID=1325125 RepID=UPI0004926FEC|nr:transcriptional regulator [Kallotenue papyrolyticum]
MLETRSHSKASRLRRIEHKLYNTPNGLSAVELAKYCGVDRRTIYRDILALEEMGVPVWQLDGRFGIDRDSYQSTVRLNLNETVALYFAARLLAHHSDENNPHVVGALDKIAASLPDATLSAHLSHAADVIRTKPMRANYVQTLETLTRAWADRQAVQIQYWAAEREHPEERVIEPYFLEVSRFEPASYVLGHDRLRNAIRTFKVERIQRAELLPEHYEIPADFDPYAWLHSSWAIMAEEEVEVRLRFAPQVARRVQESVWHHSQQLEVLPDGGCLLTMRVGGIREIRGWVLSWGADVEVLAPQELRAQVAAEGQRLAALYRHS